MFDTLSDKLQTALGDLRGRGRLDEESVGKAMREVRLALLEADVNFEVAKDFTAAVKARALGQDVLKSLSPGQQVVKIVHEELTALMGSGDSRLAFGRPPTVILLAGLQGSGKTTAAAKLALLLRREGKRPALVACDLQRPAAVEQLEQLGRQIQIPVYRLDTTDAVAVARHGLDAARRDGLDVVILDTAGRLHVDEELMDELQRVRDETKPLDVLLVLDAMTGQEAVKIAEGFDGALGITGVVMTKMDGDARGGASLSIRGVIGKPIKFIGVGEGIDDLDTADPERLAGRILQMGDVVGLVERAQVAMDDAEQARLQDKVMGKGGRFTLEDFLVAMRQVQRMGPMDQLLKLIPGAGRMNIPTANLEPKRFKHVEAIILSMTPDERRRPEILNGSRRARIARGSGRPVAEVNRLLKQFKEMQGFMKQMRGMMGGLGGVGGAPLGR